MYSRVVPAQCPKRRIRRKKNINKIKFQLPLLLYSLADFHLYSALFYFVCWVCVIIASLIAGISDGLDWHLSFFLVYYFSKKGKFENCYFLISGVVHLLISLPSLFYLFIICLICNSSAFIFAVERQK